jgi:enoyl-CoA hydratase/carnithine racemase
MPARRELRPRGRGRGREIRGVRNQRGPLLLDPERLDAEVATLVDAILAKPGAAIAMGKELFYRQIECGVEAAYQMAGQTMACNLIDPVAQEGIDAFIAKRKPAWSPGR